MRISILHNGCPLREFRHKGELHVEAPPAGDYVVRLTNDHPARRMAVLSVDGVNAVNGVDAGFDGPGYVLQPWGSIDVPGWYRDGKEVAAFSFQEQGQGYAVQTGRGIQNIGVIGVAVFNEKVQIAVPPIVIREEHHHHHHDHWPHRLWPTPHWPLQPVWCGDVLRSCSVMSEVTSSISDVPGGEPMLSMDSAPERSAPRIMNASNITNTVDVGTAYGQVTAFHTVNVTFERASASPSEIVILRYATRERLKSWGVPVDEPVQTKPQAFPAAQGCPPPPNWRG